MSAAGPSGGSLLREVALRASLVTALALGVTGVVTGVVLHSQAIRARDQLLLAAARSGAGGAPLDAEGDAPFQGVPVRLSMDPDVLAGLPPEWLVAPRLQEQVEVHDLGDQRVLILPVEQHGDGDLADAEQEAPHPILVAMAPRVRLAESVEGFAAAYLVSATIAALGAAWVQRSLLARSLTPLRRAADEARRLVGLADGRRLPEGGPEEIRALPAAVNELLDRLQVAYAAQSRFTSEAAHELRTPLAALAGDIEVTLRRPRDAEAYREALARAAAVTARLGRMVEALLALARVEAGQAESDRVPVTTGEILLTALAAEQSVLHDAGCAVDIDLAGDALVEAHHDLLVIAVTNLLRNAARHAPGARVRCWLGRRGELAVLGVDDGGRGLSAAEREDVFARFARGGEARRTSPDGLGLGLSLTREIARRHGGDCTLEAAPSGGVRAIVTLPVLSDPPSPP